ncbi:MAG: M16 family metallopeptidase [Planctomycetota bacterium]|jgi:predicted Zn-dependent peptidase
MSTITTMPLACGASLVVEPIAGMGSAAVSWLLPLGASTDPSDGEGLAALLSELVFRGAGGRGSREHSDALDRCGVQRSADVQIHHLRLGATVLGARLDDALPLLAAMVTDPALPEDALAPVRSLCLQSLDALDDEPQRRVMLMLRERHLAPPFNRHGYGRREVLERATGDRLRAHWAACCRPASSIIAVAGAVDPDRVAGRLDELLSGWTGDCPEPVGTAAAARGRHADIQPTAQVHLAAACDAPPESDPRSMHERLAIAVLSGSTSGRLFTEVRQKRSLCYSVGASYRADRDTGLVALYAGTTPERATQTLDVCLAEIERLRSGATEEEFRRAVTGLKSHLIMQGESTPARADSLARDHYRLGRARTLDELAAALDSISHAELNDYLAGRDFGDMTIVSIGPVDIAASARQPQ